MNDQNKILNDLMLRLMHIINKYSTLEKHPIRFSKDVILTPREIHTIQAVGEHEQLNVKDVGDFFGVTKSAASQMVSKLVAKGYLRKSSAADNNKELLLSLTERGQQAFAAHENLHNKHRRELENKLKSYFSEEEILTVTKLLSCIDDVFNERIAEFVNAE